MAIFDAEFKTRVAAIDQDDKEDLLLLTNFSRQFRETLSKIVEADTLIQALARGRQATIKSQLGAVVKGHTAMQGYGGGGRKRVAMGRIA